MAKEQIKPGLAPAADDPDARAERLEPMRAALLGLNPSFRGAARGKPIPPADFSKVAQAARLEPCGLFAAQALTVACGLYFELMEESRS